jgi:Fe-S oxidoreductase
VNSLRKTNLQEVKERWTLCINCAACYYRGPIVPHNWKELPPHEWSSPLRKCPSFEHYRFRAFTAAGRGILATRVFDDVHFSITNDLIEIVYTCTSCGTCNEICQAFQPLNAIWALREELVERGAPRPAPLVKVSNNIEKYNNSLGARKSPKILEDIPSTGESIYFAGCYARYHVPSVARATVEVLRAAGINVASLNAEERCCGFIPGHDGNTRLLEKMADQNIEALQSAGAKRVIVSCSHCYKALKVDYPLIYGDLPFEVVHAAELFSTLIEEGRIRFKKPIKQRITYHDPCFLGRHGKVYEAPRKVLKSIPGLELREMERYGRWSYCCGSGAKISSICYPDFARAVSKERLLEGKKAAETLVTACTTCFHQLKESARREQLDINLYDLPVLVAEAMGIPF